MGTCLTGHLEVRKNEHASWNHVLTVNFWKDYPLMIALKGMPSCKEGIPEDTTIWAWDYGPLCKADPDAVCDLAYTVDTEAFLKLVFLGEERKALTNQTRVLQASVRVMTQEGLTCRLLFLEG